MDSCVVQLTSGDIDNRKLNIRACGVPFFPRDAFGSSSMKGRLGRELTLLVEGLPQPVKTDIPTEKGTQRPRWMFRKREWVRDFIRTHGLIPGDKVIIRHVSNRTYQVIPEKRQLTFIDLFAGIGGTRIAFEKADCKCVFSSEWDKFAQQTYEANFGEKPHGDIRKILSSEIPDHDILVAGFPCQPFSISGVSKKNALGKPHGFDDPTQGTLFFEIKHNFALLAC